MAVNKEFSISRFLGGTNMVTFVDSRNPQATKQFTIHRALLVVKAEGCIDCTVPHSTQPITIPEYVGDQFGCFVDWLYGVNLHLLIKNLPYNTHFTYLIRLFEWGAQNNLWRFKNDVIDAFQDLILHDRRAKITTEHVDELCSWDISTHAEYFCGALVHWSVSKHKGLFESDLETHEKARELCGMFRMVFGQTDPIDAEKWHPGRRIKDKPEMGPGPCAFHAHGFECDGCECYKLVSLSPSFIKLLDRVVQISPP